jgi:hypothetical protein
LFILFTLADARPSVSLTGGSDGDTGNGDNLLSMQSGTDIDAHDFVLRFNTIMDGYRKYVGSKTDGMWNKPNYDKTAEKWVPRAQDWSW